MSPELELEVMRSMALLTSDAAMKRVLVGRDLMATATCACEALRLLASGVGVMAGQAPGPGDTLWMVGMYVPMAFRARGPGGTSHVMRRVAARAYGVGRDLRLSQYDHFGVTASTGERLIGLQLVRSMAPDALRMPTGKRRTHGDDWFGLAVALLASCDRVRGRRVLVGVAGRTHTIR